jgi:RHS repeat-associated protein
VAEVSLKRYRYTGKERDEETGFYYHRARQYAPWLGRWTSCDPGGVTDGVDLYLYGASNPVRFVDNDGRDSRDTVGGYYVGFFDAMLNMKTDITYKRADFKSAYAKAYEKFNWWESAVAKSVRKDVTSNQLSSDILGVTFGLVSGFVPGAPSGSDLPQSMQRSYMRFSFASRLATPIAGNFDMMESIASTPPPSPPLAPALVSGRAPAGAGSAPAAGATPTLPIIFPMASQPEPGEPQKPQVGENVGDIHPKTGHKIIAEMSEEGDKLDVLVEASKPSQQGKLTRRLLENPGTHDPSGRVPGDARRPYDPSKAVMPSDQIDLFKKSVEFEGKRYAMDSNGNIHQFQPSTDNVYHWAGAENSKTASGATRTMEIPPGVRRLFR